MNPVKIAVCATLSGPRAAYGEMLKKISEQILFDTKYFKLEYFDDGANIEKAIAVANQVCSVGADIVVGHFNSQCAIAVQQIYARNKIAFIPPTATNPALEFAEGGAVFCADDQQQIERVIEFAAVNGKRIICISTNDIYGDYLAKLSRHVAKRKNTLLTFKSVDSLETEITTSYSTEVLVWLIGAHHNAIVIQRQLRKLYADIQIIACDDCVIEEYAELAEITDNDWIVSLPGGYKQATIEALKYIKRLVYSLSNIENLFSIAGSDRQLFSASGRLRHSEWSIRRLKVN